MAPLDAKVSPVRVLHLIETGGPGGAERMLLDLAAHMGPGYESTIGLLRSGWLQSQVISSGIPCVMIDGTGRGDLGVLLRLARVVRECQIGLIHAHEFYMNAMGAIVSRLTGIPLIATVHGKGYYPDRRRRRMIYRVSAAQAAKVVAVSQDLRQFFCRTTGTPVNRVQVIYNGIDFSHFRSLRRDPGLLESCGIPRDAPIVGTVGNLYPVKGQVHLVRAMRIILGSHPDTHAVILGSGGQEGLLRSEATSLGIQDRIHLLGYREDAPRWLAAMNVFTLPSISEGLPLSLLEAMAAGLPAVVTGVGGMPEVVQDEQTGYIVPPADPEALARRILLLLENPVLARDLGTAGCHVVRTRFSQDRMLTQYRSMYRNGLVCSPRR